MDYAIAFQGKVFTPDGKSEMPSRLVPSHNADLERRELAAWSEAPDAWTVYVTDGRDVTNWTGKVLGTIIERNTFRGNIARNMTAIRFRGTNGAVYYGRFGSDWSQLCRVRKAK